MAETCAVKQKKLFTPGPLSVTAGVKGVMLRDVGSREHEFIDTISFIQKELLSIAHVHADVYTTVLLQGSGTFAVEAVLQTTTPPTGGRVLILSNGAYGKRMKLICERVGLSYVFREFDETRPIAACDVELPTDVTSVAIVHHETTSGVATDVAAVAQKVKKLNPAITVIVDAMSSFGGMELDMGNIDYMVSSANKCIQGVPGFAFAVCRREHLLSCKGYCRSLSLDLVDQLEGLERNGQFRFTPPTHAMLAFKQALVEFKEEGGLKARIQRYKENHDVLVGGMKKLGFTCLIPQELQENIITSFHYPRDGSWAFSDFYDRLYALDQVIYPGKVSAADCFRIGTIGDLQPADITHLITCVEKVLRDMNVAIPLQ